MTTVDRVFLRSQPIDKRGQSETLVIPRRYAVGLQQQQQQQRAAR
jgi:hypothetical protein